MEPMGFPAGCCKMLINSSLSSEIMKIRIATAADYMWNTGNYSPEESLYRVLFSRFGAGSTRLLYRFNDAFVTSIASLVQVKNRHDLQRHLRLIREQLQFMDELLGELDDSGFDDRLLNELKSLKERVEVVYDVEYRAVAGQIIASVESM
jgi:hypothetical protein